MSKIIINNKKINCTCNFKKRLIIIDTEPQTTLKMTNSFMTDVLDMLIQQQEQVNEVMENAQNN